MLEELNTKLAVKPKKPWIGYALASVTGGAAVLLSVVAGPFVVPALRKVCQSK